MKVCGRRSIVFVLFAAWCFLIKFSLCSEQASLTPIHGENNALESTAIPSRAPSKRPTRSPTLRPTTVASSESYLCYLTDQNAFPSPCNCSNVNLACYLADKIVSSSQGWNITLPTNEFESCGVSNVTVEVVTAWNRSTTPLGGDYLPPNISFSNASFCNVNGSIYAGITPVYFANSSSIGLSMSANTLITTFLAITHTLLRGVACDYSEACHLTNCQFTQLYSYPWKYYQRIGYGYYSIWTHSGMQEVCGTSYPSMNCYDVISYDTMGKFVNTCEAGTDMISWSEDGVNGIWDLEYTAELERYVIEPTILEIDHDSHLYTSRIYLPQFGQMFMTYDGECSRRTDDTQRYFYFVPIATAVAAVLAILAMSSFPWSSESNDSTQCVLANNSLTFGLFLEEHLPFVKLIGPQESTLIGRLGITVVDIFLGILFPILGLMSSRLSSPQCYDCNRFLWVFSLVHVVSSGLLCFGGIMGRFPLTATFLMDFCGEDNAKPANHISSLFLHTFDAIGTMVGVILGICFGDNVQHHWVGQWILWMTVAVLATPIWIALVCIVLAVSFVAVPLFCVTLLYQFLLVACLNLCLLLFSFVLQRPFEMYVLNVYPGTSIINASRIEFQLFSLFFTNHVLVIAMIVVACQQSCTTLQTFWDLLSQYFTSWLMMLLSFVTFIWRENDSPNKSAIAMTSVVTNQA